jgi:serine/threonine protein kinase
MGILMQPHSTLAVPPSKKARQQIPRGIDDLVMTCLAKDPANRLQSAKELSRRLGDLPGANAWTQERAREWWAGSS